MFNSKGSNKRICDMVSTLNEKTIHQRRMNVLLTEVYKYLTNLSPKMMNEVFYLCHG